MIGGAATERVDTRVLQVIYRVEREEPGLVVGMQVDVFLNTQFRGHILAYTNDDLLTVDVNPIVFLAMEVSHG